MAGNQDSGLTESQWSDKLVIEIRERHYKGDTIEILSREYKLAPKEVTNILDGVVSPYAGGPLRVLPLQGCNPKFQESTRNRQRFVRGIIKRAFATLTPEEFRIFANSNGMTESDAKTYAKNSEDLNERLAQERYGGVIRRHASGIALEESVIAHSGRARTRAARNGID